MIKKYSELISDQDFTTRLKKMSEDSYQFTITYKDGSFQNGYTSGADFPGLPESPTRGELFWIEVKTPGKGLGTQLVKKSLELMLKHGARTVNMNGVTPEGKALIEKLQRTGLIGSAIRTSKTGKQEHEILIK